LASASESQASEVLCCGTGSDRIGQNVRAQHSASPSEKRELAPLYADGGNDEGGRGLTRTQQIPQSETTSERITREVDATREALARCASWLIQKHSKGV